jgi:hypothetical protein
MEKIIFWKKKGEKARTKEVSENEKLSKRCEAKPPGFRKVKRWL